MLSGLDLSPRKTWACFHEVGNVPRVLESWDSLLRIGASSGAQVLSTIAGILKPMGLMIESKFFEYLIKQ